MRSYHTRKTHKKQRGGFIDALKGLFGFGVSGESTTDLPEPTEEETEMEQEEEITANSLPANMVGGRRYKTKKSKKSVRKTHHKGRKTHRKGHKSHRRRHH